MATIQDLLLQQGLSLDSSFTIRDGAGDYKVVYDSTGRAVFKIQESMLSDRLNITPYSIF